MLAIEGFETADLFAGAGFGPEPLAFALGIVGDDRAGSFENILGGAVVLFQANYRGVRKITLEVEDVADVRARQP